MTASAAEKIEAPSAALALTEFPRAMADFASLAWAGPLLSMAPRGDGHAVLVIPGFTATDASTALLRHYLGLLGYDTHSWQLGRNIGPKSIGYHGEKLLARLRDIHAASGGPVSIIGWSLGGVMARQVARHAPKLVRQVITLGSPFTGEPRASTVWRLYEMIAGQRMGSPAMARHLRESALAPPVPSTAIHTREDGIVAWQNCIEPAGSETDNIQVRGSHCGLGANPAVFYAIADRLAQPAGDWRPFERHGLRAWLYPRTERPSASPLT